MSLLDGGQKKDLPTMSWESVLDAERSDHAGRPSPGEAEPRPAPLPGSIKLEIPSLDFAADQPPPAGGDALAEHSLRPIVAPAPLPLPADEPASAAVAFSIPDIMEATPVPPLTADEQGALDVSLGRQASAPPPATTNEPLTPPPAPPAVAAPPTAPLTAQPIGAPSAASAPPAPLVPPPPPVPPAAPTAAARPDVDQMVAAAAVDAAVGALVAGARPDVDEHAVVTDVVPAVAAPETQQPAPAAVAPIVPTFQPRVQQPAGHAPIPPMSAPATPPRPRQAGRRPGRRRGLSFLLTLIVVGGLVAAAVVFGRPYLFPDQWDSAVKPYAQAAETATGVEFVEPLAVTAEEPMQYEARWTAQLFGDWEAQLPTWRALALANGQVDQPGIDQLLAGRSPAIYSQSDGQVYHDSSLTGAELDAYVTFAMAQAVIDQNLNWSSLQARRSLDDAALTEAHVLQQSLAAQRSSEFNSKIAQPDLTPLVFLPPVLGYRAMAPTMFAELLPAPVSASDPGNPLAIAGGPGPLAPRALVPATPPVLVEGETVLRDAVAMDRSFWFLAFASYLDAPQAYAASEAIVENSLSLTGRDQRMCVVGTFSGADPTQTATIGAALDAWVLGAPPELGASTSVLPDGTRQFSSCDPGVGFENGARFGAARELIGYRLGEIATAVAAAGATPADRAAEVAEYQQSGVGAGLASLAFDTSPADAAVAARIAVAAIAGAPPTVEPSVEPSVEPTGG